ncbi:MAG TPA: hypothetical protein VNX86_00240 [Rhizomicrobium sp.]|jgi:hypothetical protein|nr:hypothetical protein [Rhizomicrobium sp.]
MQRIRSAKLFPRKSNGEGLVFSAAFVGAVIAITSALYAIDIATARALLSIP